MTDKKPSADSFDKEFRMSSGKKSSVRGKIPSWIMILVGVAVMGAVVAVKQPFASTSGNGTRASLNVPGNVSSLTGETAGYSGMNDQQADPAELEARFEVKGGPKDETAWDIPVVLTGSDQPYSMEWKELATDQSGKLIPYESETKDSAVYWLDETPYEVVVKPSEEDENAGETAEGSSVITVNGQDYNVTLQPLTKKEVSALPAEKKAELITVGKNTYMLQLEEKTASEEPAPDTGTEEITEIVPDDVPFTEEPAVKAADEPVVAWLNEKPYTVTVKPYEEPSQQQTEQEPESGQKAYFEADGEMYEVSLKEADPKAYKEKDPDAPVVWIDRTPLKLLLDGGSDSGEPVEVILNPVSEEELPELLKERFGESAVETTPEEELTVTEEPEPEVTEEPKEENWFTGMFRSIFGGGDTPEPTPQVTVIAVTPTAAPMLPTATAIVVRMAPTATPQSPVRLDPNGTPIGVSTSRTTTEPKGSDLNDPALWDPSDPTPTPARRASAASPTPTKTAVPEEPDKPANVTKPEVIIVQPSDNDGTPVEVTVSPTQEELPHTGAADSWNIPSLLAMLAGLLLVIIGVRRLRTGRE